MSNQPKPATTEEKALMLQSFIDKFNETYKTQVYVCWAEVSNILDINGRSKILFHELLAMDVAYLPAVKSLVENLMKQAEEAKRKTHN